MRLTLVAASLGLGLAACSSLEPLTETFAERIEVETVDLPGRLWDPFMPPLNQGTPVTIEGLLTIPPTSVPVPAVIITHGCGGVGGAEIGWVSDLESEGIATLVLDSFDGRGIRNICTGVETVNVASILVDVFRAADQLDEHPYIDSSRMAIMGFSFGGRTALWSAMTRFQDAYDGRAFDAHVAFYPSTCYIQLEDEHLVSDNPIRIFHGTADDWTPIEQCERYVDRMIERGTDAKVYAYPDALHSFDDIGLAWAVTHRSLDAVSPRECAFVERDGSIIDPETGEVAGVGSPCVQKGVTYGYDPDARDDAKRQLTALLSEVLALP